MSKSITRVWIFMSDSNRNIDYETLKYLDGATLALAKVGLAVWPGWQPSCKHTRYVDMGTADNHCTATHNYETQNKNTSHAKNQSSNSPNSDGASSPSNSMEQENHELHPGWIRRFVPCLPEEQRVEAELKAVAEQGRF